MFYIYFVQRVLRMCPRFSKSYANCMIVRVFLCNHPTSFLRKRYLTSVTLNNCLTLLKKLTIYINYCINVSTRTAYCTKCDFSIDVYI